MQRKSVNNTNIEINQIKIFKDICTRIKDRKEIGVWRS